MDNFNDYFNGFLKKCEKTFGRVKESATVNIRKLVSAVKSAVTGRDSRAGGYDGEEIAETPLRDNKWIIFILNNQWESVRQSG